jgi:16S rRNA (adenine1518-N6/adenine1519-N6)-dimethyltransferase
MNSNLDQHFMIDKELIKRIIKYSKLKKTETVLEIGPGKGALTKELSKKSRVIAVEKDETLKPFLENIPNTTINFTNAISYLKTHKWFDKIIANIPYVISEPLLNQLKHVEFNLAILTVGSKFAKKLLGEEESRISITAPIFFEIKRLEVVPKTSFNPKPSVDSAVIQIKPKTKLSKQESLFKDFLLQEDKLAKNALRETLTKAGLTKREAKEKIQTLTLDLNKNIKLLSLNEIKKLKKFIFEV